MSSVRHVGDSVRRLMGSLVVPGLPVPVNPARRRLLEALEYIRDHQGEDLARLRERQQRNIRRMGVQETHALEREERQARREDIGVGDTTMFGDLVAWHVVEARPAGDGMYVLVVQR